MRVTPFAFRAVRSLALGLALSATVAACGDDDDEAAEEPNPANVTLTITGGASPQTLTWNVGNQAVTGGPIAIPAGQTRTITLTQALRADGTPDPVVTTGTFRLDVLTENNVTFSRGSAGNFAGTLTAGAAGGGSVAFELYHLGENHREYGPSNEVTVTVQ